MSEHLLGFPFVWAVIAATFVILALWSWLVSTVLEYVLLRWRRDWQ